MMLLPNALSEPNATRLMYSNHYRPLGKAPRRVFSLMATRQILASSSHACARAHGWSDPPIPGWVPGLSHPQSCAGITRGMWCEAIGNSKSKLNTVIGQPRQQSDAQETHRLKDGVMDAWNRHEAIVLAASSMI
jgi:hypothetical protein